jgi:hypothetical protein
MAIFSGTIASWWLQRDYIKEKFDRNVQAIPLFLTFAASILLD